MLHFECDYNNGCHPKVLERLCETNAEPQSGYGFDEFSASAKEKIRCACACPEAEITFLAGGTQTNAVVISAMLEGYEGVVAVETGHVAAHESGAIEYTGHKVLTLPGHDGKMDAQELEAFVAGFYTDGNYEHMVFPGMVYLSWPTEYGTLYTRRELETIHAVCRRFNMPLYIDGARLGYGLMSPACDLTLPELARLCDVFYIGGTKVGALCGEAVVFPDGRMPRHFFSTVKQHGALFAKGRLCGVQFDALFTDGLYFALSRHAIEAAESLKSLLREKGYEFYLSTPTNQQFVIVSDEKREELEKKVVFSFWSKPDAAHTVIRFCTSWSTTAEEIEALRGVL